MKIYKYSDNTGSLKSLIFQLKLTIEFSQIKEILFVYRDLLVLITNYSFLFEDSSSEIPALKGNPVYVETAFFTQDPARDGVNWYGYCSNNPLYDPGMNDKFVSLDGKNETVYNKETGQKITDPVNQGTYNRADPNKDPIGHFFQDMIPYYVWGNSEDDPTTAWEIITGSYQGNVNATKEEASQFRVQMNEENRNKAMEPYYEHH